MSVSSRLRFEILRRDDHACRYCGARAPDVALTVDHVIPTALGGRDEPSNLVTACASCNAGKSSSSPDAPVVAQVADDAVRWAAAVKHAGAVQADRSADRAAYVRAFDEAWRTWTYSDGGPISRPAAWASTIGRHFDLGLELVVLLALVDDVLPRGIADGRMWTYFCGALRNTMLERQRIASELLAREEEAGVNA